ncbi:MAG TPA: DUF1259 domain-containing protein [Gemmatimonadales bacterium]|nr:DUF1259 domain-containing protein [Gemmatimonadales bacterium]
MRHLIAVSILLSALPAASALAQVPANPEWARIATILGTTAADGGGYVRYNVPRADLDVHVGTVAISAPFALTSWAGFSGTPDSATVMGDLVVTEAEIQPVLAELDKRQIDVMAVHNHLTGELPHVMYVHFHAYGSATDIARRLEAVLKLTGAPRPVAAAHPSPLVIDSGAVFQALGKHGRANGSFAQVSYILVPGAVTMHGHTVVPSLGYGSPVNIVQVSPARAVSTGDFAVTAGQLPRLLHALAQGGITATAVHSHMVGEQPALYFVHFWGDAPLPELLKSLRAAVDAVQP